MSFLFRKRRSMGAEQGRLAGVPTPAGIQSMDENLQKKFAKGIQFNIKILIRGDRNTGKSCLFHRMQGKQFAEAYLPTNEIQVASILWSYRVTNDTVKVEVWDIVDKGRSQKKTGKSLLKMFNEPSTETDPSNVPLDAEFMDVYKGAHGVVFTYDMTKQWTWKYIERELPKVPLHIPIIVLGNFRDMGEHRVVSRDEAVLFINTLDRPDGAAPVRYAESSMKNGFGLMHLHKFLSVPFLQLQQETLLQQLQVNREQTLAAQEELDSASKSEDQSYDMFLEKLQRLTDERKKKAPPPTTPDTPTSVGGDSPRVPHHSEAVEAEEEEVTSPTAEPQRSGSLSSRLFSGLLSRNKEVPKKEMVADSTKPTKPAKSAMTIDDFVPEGGGVESFLEGSEDEGEEEDDTEEDSDDDVDGGNPQVALDEDLSSPEEEAPPINSTPLVPEEAPPINTTPEVKKQPKPLKSANEIVLTESEEESDEPTVMEDEDEPGEELKKETEKKPAFTNVPLEQLFEVPRKKATKKKSKKPVEDVVEIAPVTKPSKKSSGLLLEFSPTPPPTGKATPPAAESPVVKSERRDSKKKKSKKRDSEGVKSGGMSEGVSVGGASETSNDPFGAIASLDAWLNSDSTDKDGASQSNWGTAEVADEADKETEKKPKKHKHRRHREEGEEDSHRRHGEEGSRRRRHKHKSSSRHRTEQEEDRD